MSTAGSPMTAGPLKWSDIVLASLPAASELLFDDALERIQAGHEQVFATLHSDEGGKVEEEGSFGAGNRQLRAFTAGPDDRVLLARIESDELGALHPFVLHKLELPFDVRLDEQLDQATIDAVVFERALRQMWAVLDPAPDQPVPPQRGRPFQWRRARIGPTQVRAKRAAQTVVVAGIA